MEDTNRVPSNEQDWSEGRFEQIIGNSPALNSVLAKVRRVAPTDATALVLGETGTGKELIARAIHNSSPRCARPFIKLNCAAIPFDLLESELFGHEKGAFTGAIAQKIGRFEMADRGTLFLDEIGDIPMALQPKLLRVLQEQEFERVGSGKTHRINVRLVAATHRDLTGMVRRKEFRSDLYYRINVFPIVLPPLRERRRDIPQLVSYFVEVFSRRVDKHIKHIAKETLDAFTSYSWPGNVRELQNLIERAVICSDNGVLPHPFSTEGGPMPLTSAGGASKNVEPAMMHLAKRVLLNPLLSSDGNPVVPTTSQVTPEAHTFKDYERALILHTLEAAGWVVGGSHGAAARLGLKRTTLVTKMKKLGILRPLQQVEGLDQNRDPDEPWQPLLHSNS
jgi:formate hydrogenlyase transcriptional activator